MKHNILYACQLLIRVHFSYESNPIQSRFSGLTIFFPSEKFLVQCVCVHQI